MNKNILESIKKSKEYYKKKKQTKQLQKEHVTRVEELYKQFHTVKKVKLPIINAFVWDIIEKQFHGFENMDFSDMTMLGTIIFLLENQEDNTLIDKNKEWMLTEGKKRLMTIPAPYIMDYTYCIYEILEMLKKKFSNNLKTEMDEIQDLVKILSEDFVSG